MMMTVYISGFHYNINLWKCSWRKMRVERYQIELRAVFFFFFKWGEWVLLTCSITDVSLMYNQSSLEAQEDKDQYL